MRGPVAVAEPECVICGSLADSHEHVIKASDLKARRSFGPGHELYLYRAKDKRYLPLQSPKSRFLKPSANICHDCNTSLTAPYDTAWEAVSEHLMKQLRPPALQSLSHFELVDVFGVEALRQSVNLQLFFAKYMACMLREHEVGIEFNSFSQPIREGKAHPHIFLSFGYFRRGVLGNLGVSTRREVSDLDIACTFMELDSFAVRIFYCRCPDVHEGHIGAWHPAYRRSRVFFERFD